MTHRIAVIALLCCLSIAPRHAEATCTLDACLSVCPGGTCVNGLCSGGSAAGRGCARISGALYNAACATSGFVGVVIDMYVNPTVCTGGSCVSGTCSGGTNAGRACDPAYADVDGIATAAPDTLTKRVNVYGAIRNEADTVQTRVPAGSSQSIRDRLTQAVSQGTAQAGWAPHWLGDQVTAGATRPLIAELCARADVRFIREALTYSPPIHSDTNPSGGGTSAAVSGAQASAAAAVTSATPAWNIQRVGADSAWTKGFKGRGVKVGIIDTGIDATHPDLNSVCQSPGKPQDGKSCVGNCTECGCSGTAADACTNNGGVCLGPAVDHTTGKIYWKDLSSTASATPIDDLGHGTFAAGIAVGRNGIGVAPEANWMACKGFVNSGGFPSYQNETWLIECAEYLINPDGVDAAHMDPSHAAKMADVVLVPYVLGGRVADDASACDPLGNSSNPSDNVSFQQKVARMRAMDVLPVFPVGENFQTQVGANGVPSPANYRGAFAVGISLDTPTYDIPLGQNPIHPVSNYGSILCLDDEVSTDRRPAPAVVAPGLNIYGPWAPSAVTTPDLAACQDQHYCTLKGSDAAAAHVAGAAALLRGINADLSAQRSPWANDKRFFMLDEVLKRRAKNFVGQHWPTEAGVCVRGTNNGTGCTIDSNCTGGGVCQFMAGRLDLATAVSYDFAAPDAAVIPSSFPSPFYASDPGIPNTQAVQVSIRNWSPYTWTAAAPAPADAARKHGPIKLVDAAYPTDVWTIGKVGLGSDLRPGEENIFSFNSTAPSSLGAAGGTLAAWYQYNVFNFQFQMFCDSGGSCATANVRFGESTPNAPKTVTGKDRAQPGTLSPSLARLAAGLGSPPSACGTIYVPMTNGGTTAWTPSGVSGADTYTAYWWLYYPNGITVYTSGVANLPAGTVGPGGAANFPVYLCAPVADGTYPFRLEVRRNGNPLAFGNAKNDSMYISNNSALDAWTWECDPARGCPWIHWHATMRNNGTRLWDANYCLYEIRGRSWAYSGLPAAPECLLGGNNVVVAQSADHVAGSYGFDGYLYGDYAPYGLWYYQLQLFRPDGAAFGPAPAGLVGHTWTVTSQWNPGQQGYGHWYFFGDNATGSPLTLAWRGGSSQWQRWTGSAWADPWIDQWSLRPGSWGLATRAWQSPTSGRARAIVTFSNYTNGSCTTQDGVGISIDHMNSSWYALQSWVPNGYCDNDYSRSCCDGSGCRNGLCQGSGRCIYIHLPKDDSATVDTGDPSHTSVGDPNGFSINAGDYITSSAGIWSDSCGDVTYDTPVTIYIWQTTPETATNAVF